MPTKVKLELEIEIADATMLNPPTVNHLLWVYIHEHGHGADSGLFWATNEPSEAQLAEKLGLDYEPERGESITMANVGSIEIKTI